MIVYWRGRGGRAPPPSAGLSQWRLWPPRPLPVTACGVFLPLPDAALAAAATRTLSVLLRGSAFSALRAPRGRTMRHVLGTPAARLRRVRRSFSFFLPTVT